MYLHIKSDTDLSIWDKGVKNQKKNIVFPHGAFILGVEDRLKKN